MASFWHPLSTLLLADPPCFATTRLVSMLLAAGPVELRYAGDRMWPAVEHGATVIASPKGPTLAAGDLVVAVPDGVPDLLRVVSGDADRVRLVADADPADVVELPADAVLASVGTGDRVPPAGVGRRRRRRLWLDAREAWSGRVDDGEDPAGTVLFKYDHQAPFYATSSGHELEPALLERIRSRVPAGESILVLGSGSGRECFVLAQEGWRVTGVDFAPAMVRVAREEAERRGLTIEFVAVDLREYVPPVEGFRAVLFTYDVYSFLPDEDVRVAVLRRLRSALAPGGVVFLSARRVRSIYQRLVLTVQWFAGPRNGRGWGRSHTRWIGMDGELRRSFVQVFGQRRLTGEIRRSGFTAGPWRGGHAVLTPRT